MSRSLYPIVALEQIEISELNSALVSWKHKMGALARPGMEPWFHGLYDHDRLVAVSSASRLVNATAGGFTRGEAFELSRVCAIEPDWCRVMLRLWRNTVFPLICRSTSCEYAISYQDADVHTGNLYRFDGWARTIFSHSGTDTRSGRKGRNKWIWVWHSDPVVRARLRIP